MLPLIQMVPGYELVCKHTYMYTLYMDSHFCVSHLQRANQKVTIAISRDPVTTKVRLNNR